MLHKISQFCNKIDNLKRMSDKLRTMKYGNPKASDEEIDNMIVDIQSECLLLANDKSNMKTFMMMFMMIMGYQKTIQINF